MKKSHKNLKKFFMVFLLLVMMIPALSGFLVSGQQTKVADVTIDFTWIELAKDGDAIGKGEIHLWCEDPFGFVTDWDLGKHATLDEWDPDKSKTWTRVFFDVTPIWDIHIYDKDGPLFKDILFSAELEVYEYSGTGTKYANNKENWGTRRSGPGYGKTEMALNDYIGTYCSYLWSLGESDLNTFYVWTNYPYFLSTSARLTISVTIDYYWWNIW